MNFCPHAKLIRNTVKLESSVVFRALYQLRNAKLPVKMGSSFVNETNKLLKNISVHVLDGTWGVCKIINGGALWSYHF